MYRHREVRSLSEPLQVGMDNGAMRALVPLESKRNFLKVSRDILEWIDPVFFFGPHDGGDKIFGCNIVIIKDLKN
jgi:ATP-dependent Lon protease